MAENPVKDINAKLTFLSSASDIWHLVEIFQIPLLHVLSSDACKFTINLFPISWENSQNVNLLYLLFLMQIWNGCDAFNIVGNPIKDINAKLTFLCSASDIWHLVEIFQIPLLHVLSSDACKFAINLFPISWENSQNVNLLYLLFLMQIWNGCDAFNIIGNPIKDINAKLTFLCSASDI